MGFFKDFKNFAVRGNVLDLAVGIIIGAAFGSITQSLVNDMIMPPLGKFMGNVDFSNLYIPLDHQRGIHSVEEARKSGAVIAYGKFIQSVVNFIVISFSVYLIVRLMMVIQHKDKEEKAAPSPVPSKEEILLTEIRDALRYMRSTGETVTTKN